MLAVAIGGLFGALARVFLPWPTVLDSTLQVVDPAPVIVINLIGAALLGLVSGYTTVRPWPEPLNKGITTGFFGSFTTMSALTVIYSGFILGQTTIMTASLLESTVTALVIVAVLVVFLALTTMVTIAMIRLGTRLAGDQI